MIHTYFSYFILGHFTLHFCIAHRLVQIGILYEWCIDLCNPLWTFSTNKNPASSRVLYFKLSVTDPIPWHIPTSCTKTQTPMPIPKLQRPYSKTQLILLLGGKFPVSGSGECRCWATVCLTHDFCKVEPIVTCWLYVMRSFDSCLWRHWEDRIDFDYTGDIVWKEYTSW